MKGTQTYIERLTGKINWQLLLFLLLAMDVKVMIKVIVIPLFAIVNWRMFREKQIYRQRFILFYISMIAIALLNVFLHATFAIPYLILVGIGCYFWLLGGLSAGLNWWYVKNTDKQTLHNTLTVFFILNALVTFAMLAWIMIDSGSLNPYRFQGFHQKYFISTGDWLRGITFDMSTTNGLINAFGVIYFLQKQKNLMVFVCVITLILTSSNFTNIILAIALLYVLIFNTNRDQKSIIIACLMLFVIFLVKISPQDSESMQNIFRKMAGIRRLDMSAPKPKLTVPEHLSNEELQKRQLALAYLDSVTKAKVEQTKHESPVTVLFEANAIKVSSIKPSLPKDNIHSEPFQFKRDTDTYRHLLLEFANRTYPGFGAISSFSYTRKKKIPGKIRAARQTLYFFQENPLQILTGHGMGRFSSKLAFRAAGLRIGGGYPEKYVYRDKDFIDNHLHLYLSYFAQDKDMHSLIHSPNSVYDQLLSEYGIAGLLAFAILYLAYFFKRIRKTSYGIPLLIILLSAFGIEYWYEQLSIIILFELMMCIQIKEMNTANE